MANDKKFIVKNGLLTEEDVIIGSTTDTGERLQITGTSKFTGAIDASQTVLATPTVTFTNSGGTGGAVIAKFVGDSDALQILNVGTGDYKITNAGQDNGLIFYDDTSGVEILYNGSVDLDFNSTGIDFKREPSYNGYVFWNAGNDGSGSGLDADVLDGLDSTQFLRSDEDDTMTGNLTVDGQIIVTGDLYVSGTTTYANTVNMLVSDNIFTLNADYKTGTPTENSGFEIRRGSQANSSLLWDETNDWFKLISAGTDLGRIITTADEGAGNGFDADSVDGLHAGQFLRADADDTANGHITFEDDITIGDGIGNARISFAVTGQDRDLYANNGEIGFLNASLNWAAYSDASDNWVVTSKVFGTQFVDADNNNYYIDPASTSVVNNIELGGNLSGSGGNTNDYINIQSSLVRTYIDNILRWSVGLTENISNVIIKAPAYYDLNDENYFVDPAGDSEVKTILLDDYVRHRFNANTYIGFETNDTFRVWTDAVQRLNIDNNSADFSVDVYGPRYYDSNDNNYYGDFASTSQMAQVDIDDYVRHRGNTTTYFGFPGADIFKVYIAGSQVLNLDSNSADFTQYVYAPRYYDSNNTAYYGEFEGTSQMSRIDIDDYIRHRGDTNTYMGFGAADNWAVWTGGTQRLSIGNTQATFSVPVNITAANSLNIADYILHYGDTDTYFGFDAADSFGIWVGGFQAMDITSIGNSSLSSPGYVGIGTTPSYKLDVNTGTEDGIARFRSTDANAWITVMDSTTNAFIVASGSHMSLGGQASLNRNNLNITVADGNVGIGTDAPGTAAKLVLSSLTGVGANPFNTGNKLLSIQDNKVAKTTWSLDNSGNNWLISESDSQFVFSDSGATIAATIDTSTGNVIIGDQSPLYTDGGDNTPLVAAMNAAKLHVNGSIYLNGANDGIIFGRGTASFLRDEELGFGWGGGFYMTEATTVKVRNNKHVSSTGNAYFAQFIDANDNTYYLDPNNTDVALKIAGESLAGNGALATPTYSFVSDTDTGMYRYAADTIGFSAGGNDEFRIYTTYTFSPGSSRAPIFYDSDDTNYYGNFASTSQMNRIDLDDYVRHRGDTNTYMGFNAADQWRVATGGTVRLQINNTTSTFQNSVVAPIYYDADNTAYYGNFASFSVMNGINFGVPGNGTNTGGRWISIEGNTDTSGEGSSRVFFAEHNSTTASMSNYGMSLGYRGGGTSITGGDGNSWTGLSQINNGEWALWGHNNSATGNWAMKGPRDASYVQARSSFRAPIFYDSNDTSYYTDQAGTSLHNIQRANRYQVDGSTYFIDTASGDYGSIRVEGNKNSWAGYAINDDWVFMSSGSGAMGLYNDTRNEWSLYAEDNSFTRLYANGVHQVSAENGYGYSPNQHRSPIYYDTNTSWYGDFDSHSRMNSISVGNQGAIANNTYALSAYHNSRYLFAMRYSGSGSNYPWLVHDNYNYSGIGSRDAFIVHFNGLGDRLYLTEDGNMLITGEMSASNYNLNGGNENISMNPAYGSGLADDVLFDGTKYWEARVIQSLQGVENNATGTTSEYVKNNNGPFSSTYALRTSGYRTFDSDYIEVEPGEELYGEIAVRYISGSGGNFYMGIRRYDKDKNPIAGNDGITYFVVGGANYTSTSWSTYSGYTTIPTSHTVYNGSDGGGCKYVRVIVLMNYSTGGAVREFGPPILKRANSQTRIRTPELISAGNVTAGSNMYAQRYYDSNNNAYYGDFASTSHINDIRTNIIYDRGDTTYFWNGNADHAMRVYGEISNSNYANGNLQPGALNIGRTDTDYRWDGTTWSSDVRVGLLANASEYWEFAIHDSGDEVNSFLYYDGTNDLYIGRDIGWGTMNVWMPGDAYAPRFYDQNNTSYYGDFASTSKLNYLDTANYVTVGGGTTQDSNNPYNSVSSTRLLFGSRDSNAVGNYFIGTNMENYGGNYTKLDLRWHTGIRMGAQAVYGGTRIFNNEDLDTLLFSVGRGDTNTRVESGSFYSNIMYDRDDTNFYSDPASTSRLNTIDINEGYNYGWWRNRESGEGLYNQATTQHWYSDSDDGWNVAGGTAANWIRFRDEYAGTIRGYVYAENNNNIGFLNNSGGWALRTNNSTTEVYGNIYANVFYDRNDNAYYLDPNGTSRLANITMNFLQFDDGWDIYDDDGDTLNIRSNNSDHGEILFRDSNSTICGEIYFDDDNHWGLKTPSDEWAVYIERDARVYTYYNGTWEERTNNGYMEARGSYRAPIFYDSNNTSFYVNPDASGSYGRDGGVSAYFRGGIAFEAYEVNNNARIFYGDDTTAGGANGDSDVYNYGRQNSGQNAYGLIMEAGYGGDTGFIKITDDGVMIGGAADENLFIWYDEDYRYNRGVVDNSGNLIFYTSMRAPIFYDYNNTGYYMNPAGNSNISTMDFDRLDGPSNSSYDKIRVYDSSEYAIGMVSGITHGYLNDWAMTFTFNNDSDRGWVFRDTGHSVSGAAMSLSTNGYMSVSTGVNIGYGEDNTSYGTSYNLQVNGTAYASSYMISPVFYDANDSAFRFNGASEHDTRFRGVHYETMAYINQPGHTRNSGEYYRARPRITTDTNYWTGSMGWGTIDMNTVATWGSGFIDSWSNPANQPSGTSHWVGTQAWHYATDDYRYGWQMVGGPIGNLRFRQAWGNSFGSWRTIAMNGVNSESGGALYAGAFYDSNDTNYYVDPASTSNMYNLSGINNIAFNSGWDIYDADANDFWVQSNDNDNGAFHFKEGNSDNGGYLYFDDDGSIFAMYHDNGEAIIYSDQDYITYTYYNGTWEGRTRSGYYEARGSFRAPIFYDQNDTNYYWDGASTSRSNYHRINNLYDSQERRYTSPNGGQYTTSTSQVTGAFRIRLPTNRYKSNTMLKFKVSIYEYNTGRTHEFLISGYNYGDANATWYNVSATQLTDSGRGAFTIRWGQNGTDQLVCIGETNTVWDYPQVHVQWVDIGYSGYSTNWGQDWVIDVVTSFDTISQTRTASQALTLNNASNWNTALYATTYYDYNNTNYYTNPNSISNVLRLDANELRCNGYIYHGGDTDTYIRFVNNDDLQLVAGGRQMLRMDEGTNPDQLRFVTDDNWTDSNGDWQMSRNIDVLGDASAATFSDVEDTGWYMDLSNTSRVNLIQANELQSSGNITAYVSYSDIRYKEDIEIIEDAIEKVKSLDGITYKYIGDEKTYTGVIAQQVEEVLPGVVYEVDIPGTDKKKKAVNYGNIVGLLIQSTKEQQETIEKQQEEIDSLKEMVYNLLEKLDK